MREKDRERSDEINVELDQAKADFDGKAKKPVEPWQIIMLDVAKMMKQAIWEADVLLREYVGHWDTVKGDAVIRMAVSIFDATVTAEGGRRMVEAQKEMAQNPHIQGGLILQLGPDGRPIPRR
ncbi:hypothetical protein LCGC14_0990290 [marine sediment metagenome]|uniref:Uncharacterized protein n=1 Tax=marine sediment metagenome TaxID=412755 RepID=A0A0F9NSQ6_9ZZZZ